MADLTDSQFDRFWLLNERVEAWGEALHAIAGILEQPSLDDGYRCELIGQVLGKLNDRG